MAASTNNYYIGKGIVSFKKEGGAYVDLGNCPKLEFEPSAEVLDHFSSREGVKTLDLSVVLSRSGVVRITLEEFTLNNLSYALLGAVAGHVIDIFSVDSVTGELKFIGTNDVGRKFELILNKVTFLPANAISLISEEFGQIELEGKAQVDSGGDFGTLTELTASSGY